jgi:hypothetical protein
MRAHQSDAALAEFSRFIAHRRRMRESRGHQVAGGATRADIAQSCIASQFRLEARA